MDWHMIILLGCVGGIIPDVIRIVQNRREPSLPDYVKSANFWIGLALLLLLGGLAAWLAGFSPRESACECERSSGMLLAPVLNLTNGPVVAEALKDPDNRLAKILAANPDSAKAIEELYLAVLCRLPQANEMEIMQKHFAATGDKLRAAQDVMWVLFNTKELLFNY